MKEDGNDDVGFEKEVHEFVDYRPTLRPKFDSKWKAAKSSLATSLILIGALLLIPLYLAFCLLYTVVIIPLVIPLLLVAVWSFNFKTKMRGANPEPPKIYTLLDRFLEILSYPLFLLRISPDQKLF